MIYDDEIQLKKKLDSVGIRYDDSQNGYRFVVTFYDNKNSSILASNVYNSPIGAVRDLGQVIKSTQFPAEDIDIKLQVAFSNDSAYSFTDILLSPYLYYKKKDIQVQDKDNK